MARAFKDMIVQEADGKPRLTFRNRQGATVLEDVAVEVSSTVQQQGDSWDILMAKQGSIKHYRQSGATKAPADLPYSEIAVAKDGTVYAGNESNQPVEQAKASHTHDDRYYTETEMNTKMNGKANSIHSHTKDQVGLSKVNNNAIGMSYDGNLWISFS